MIASEEITPEKAKTWETEAELAAAKKRVSLLEEAIQTYLRETLGGCDWQGMNGELPEACGAIAVHATFQLCEAHMREFQATRKFISKKETDREGARARPIQRLLAVLTKGEK